MQDLTSQLKAIAKGEAVPRGGWRCSGCGQTYVRITPPRPPHQQQPATRFRIDACPCCCHIVNLDAGRDLTRDEAAELAACPDFARVRAVIDEHAHKIAKWG